LADLQLLVALQERSWSDVWWQPLEISVQSF